ncbi:MAG: hypothetical protein ACREVC_15000 [Burkholderiales bacterium]
MTFDWSGLREPAPGTLVAARGVAHWALQWASKAARANLAPAPDDSHSALAWEAGLEALVSAPLAKGARVGLQLATLGLIVTHEGKAELLKLEGCTPRTVDDWLDLKLKAQGLKAASAARLPYAVAPRELKNDPGLAALARWFAAAAEVLEEVRARRSDLRPSAVVCWPHHFDIALVLPLSPRAGDSARSVGVGVSPGDEYYPQPYAYVSPSPAPKARQLPALPPGGHWHTKDFFGAVATAEALLRERDPRAALLAVIEAAFEAERRWLDR